MQYAQFYLIARSHRCFRIYSTPSGSVATLARASTRLCLTAGVIMRNLGLGLLLRVIAIVPLLALAAFGGILVKQSYDEYRDITHVAALQRLASAAATLATAVPRESQYAYPYLASGAEAD